jgi:DNA-binding transcriptional regulator PaaX
LIKFAQGRNGWRLELTENGLMELMAYELRQKLIDSSKPWDGRWRFLIFDIPETRRVTRDQIRRSLISFGFYRLQNSVWVFPYECEEVLELLRINYGVRYDALYLRAEKVAKDQRLRRYFGLPLE